MPFFLVATSKSQPENVFLGVRTIIGSTVSEHCCRCQQWLGSRTDHSVLYDTDYYQQVNAPFHCFEKVIIFNNASKCSVEWNNRTSVRSLRWSSRSLFRK